MSHGTSLGPRGPKDRLIIPKGTIVHSTFPHWPPEGKPSIRNLDLTRLTFVRWEQDRIVWAGAQGYWRWVLREDLPTPTSTRLLR